MLGPDETGLTRATEILRAGGLVAFPTETVYGLGADACNGKAVAQIFAAKDRPAFNPLIVHVATLEMAQSIARFGDPALRLAAAFWPGPLTLVLPLHEDACIAPIVTADLPTIGLRLPEHPVAQRLLNAFGGPIAAPSANLSGKISPTTAAHVANGLSGRIDAILDAGPCKVGLESTIIGFDPVPTLLRPGGLPVEVIEACLGAPLAERQTSETPNAPGQLTSHYAPKSPIRLNAKNKSAKELKLGFGPDADADLNLSPSGDLTEAAANLFTHLHTLDRKGRPIAVAPIPKTGLGIAINDRLTRAAAPRN